MDKRVAFLTGIGVGAGFMYLLDPDRGRRRRALMRDQAVHLSHKTKEVAEKTARDLRNRAAGVVAETKARLSEDHVPDPVLVDRVKAELGRYPVHDRALQIQAEDGTIILSGDALASEINTISEVISSVRGVKNLVNNALIHESSEGISSLQGEPLAARSAGGSA